MLCIMKLVLEDIKLKTVLGYLTQTMHEAWQHSEWPFLQPQLLCKSFKKISEEASFVT